MPNRSNPYSNFSYFIEISRSGLPMTQLGGFEEVAGLKNIQFGFRGVSELRRAGGQGGISAAGNPQRIQGLNKVNDVTLKRGVVNSSPFWSWVTAARASAALAKRDGTITLRDETGQPVKSWSFTNAVISHYSGPSLSGKSSDVAIEELEICPERIWIVPPK